MNVYYISAEGNTRHFVERMKSLFGNITLHRITSQTDLFEITSPYFCFVPTYVTPVGKSYREDDETLAMHDMLSYRRNYRNCLGVIASGNHNFGDDCYCWTGKSYAKYFHVPLIAEYELRGSMNDENDINHKMIRKWNQATGDSLKFRPRRNVNPRLMYLERKYNRDLHGRTIMRK